MKKITSHGVFNIKIIEIMYRCLGEYDTRAKCILIFEVLFCLSDSINKMTNRPIAETNSIKWVKDF